MTQQTQLNYRMDWLNKTPVLVRFISNKNKLRLLNLATDGVPVAAKLESQSGLVTLPLNDALKS